MSDGPLIPEPSFGEFLVTANGHYDHEGGVWYQPWTDKPARVLIGYSIDSHPQGERLGYTYLVIDVDIGVVRWHNGPFGDPERDPIVAEMPYR